MALCNVKCQQYIKTFWWHRTILHPTSKKHHHGVSQTIFLSNKTTQKFPASHKTVITGQVKTWVSQSVNHRHITYVAIVSKKMPISRRTCRLTYAGRSQLVGDIDSGGRLLNADLHRHNQRLTSVTQWTPTCHIRQDHCLTGYTIQVFNQKLKNINKTHTEKPINPTLTVRTENWSYIVETLQSVKASEENRGTLWGPLGGR